ncbi:hypothetical protein T01_13445 [Trichinella spiralis]|uniref:Uncharacterized protein n=1 Tax=Trichinella spiralis TaxID=6334 RepID=A0A0V1BB36_TRISP|nr:hypothetical protein T01_13445 [Trichinella spiralis]
MHANFYSSVIRSFTCVVTDKIEDWWWKRSHARIPLLVDIVIRVLEPSVHILEVEKDSTTLEMQANRRKRSLAVQHLAIYKRDAILHPFQRFNLNNRCNVEILNSGSFRLTYPVAKVSISSKVSFPFDYVSFSYGIIMLKIGSDFHLQLIENYNL